MSGKKFSSFVDEAMSDVYKENLTYAAKVLEENGIVGLIEPISDVVVPHYFMNNFKLGNFVFVFKFSNRFQFE